MTPPQTSKVSKSTLPKFQSSKVLKFHKIKFPTCRSSEVLADVRSLTGSEINEFSAPSNPSQTIPKNVQWCDDSRAQPQKQNSWHIGVLFLVLLNHWNFPTQLVRYLPRSASGMFDELYDAVCWCLGAGCLQQGTNEGAHVKPNAKYPSEGALCAVAYSMAAIAQLGERQTEDLTVPGSIPSLGNSFWSGRACSASIAHSGAQLRNTQSPKQERW